MKHSVTFRNMVRGVVTMAAFLLVAACASDPMSPATMRSLDKTATMGIVRNDPQAFRDKVILTGGEIVSVRNTKDGGEIEVLEFALDSSGRPDDLGDSPGRFLARSRSLLDPEVYRKGRLVTLAGAVVGNESRTIDKASYSYVVLAIREIHAWRPQMEAPYQYPGAAYYYDPFFYDPYYFSPYYSGPYILSPGWYDRGRGFERGRDFERNRGFEGSRGGERSRGFEGGRGSHGGIRSFEGGRGGGHGGGHGWGGGGRGGGHGFGGGGRGGGGHGGGGHGGGRGGGGRR